MCVVYYKTNYKTSFLLPHDYEIPTFNYPEYVLPPVPYNYKEYTKDIWDANTIQPLKIKITAPRQCKKRSNDRWDVNLFDYTAEYKGYYETEIDLKQIDPTIQSISKFQDAYKTIEISNLSNLQVECGSPNIENFIPNRNINLKGGGSTCGGYNFGSLSNITLQDLGRSQVDKVNFENTITLYTKNITNDIQTFATAYTNCLPSYDDYQSKYLSKKNKGKLSFLFQVTKLSNNYNNKIREIYLQAYYTNNTKLKIRFIKVVNPQLFLGYQSVFVVYFGNDKDIVLDVSNPNVLGIRNKSDSDVKITIKPR